MTTDTQATPRTDALAGTLPEAEWQSPMTDHARTLERQFNYAVERADIFEREAARLRAALEALGTFIQAEEIPLPWDLIEQCHDALAKAD